MIRVFKLICKGIYDLRLNKCEHFLTFLAIAMVSFLGLIFLLFLNNIENQILKNNNQVTFTIYWKNYINKKKIQEQWDKISKMQGLQNMETYTSREAFSLLLSDLGKNLDMKTQSTQKQLPPTAVLTYQFQSADLKSKVENKYQKLKKLKGIKNISYNRKSVKKSSAWLNKLENIIWPFMVFLILLTGLIVGNTVKISQFNKKEEIEVLKLVGASNWHIRIPLLSGAGMLTLLGGLVALGLLKYIQNLLNKILNQPPLWIELQYPSQGQILTVLSCLLLVSILSSWVAVES